MNIGVAGEFLVMASTLTHIKSRMLLPSYDKATTRPKKDDPRIDLVEQLKEHMRIKAAAEALDRAAPAGPGRIPARSGGQGGGPGGGRGKQGEEISGRGIRSHRAAFPALDEKPGHGWSWPCPPASAWKTA
jgi:hypothetical protein